MAHSYDATEHKHLPDAVVMPISEEEIVGVVKLAYERGIPIVPRGAGTSLSGGPIPIKGGIVVDLTLMNKIKDIDLENSLVTVEPGVVYADLNKALERHGLFFPPDPGSGKVCTIGGMASTNSSGIRAVKYGTTKDYVSSLRVVLPNGEVIKLGSKAKKSSSGYNLKDLFIGSEGTLGLFTEIILRLIPKPTNFATAKVDFEDLEDAGKAVTEIITSGVAPAVLEIMDRYTLRAVQKFSKISFEDVDAILLIETDGFSDEVVKDLEKAVEICEKHNALKVEESSSDEERERLWEARKAALPSLARHKPTLILEDVTVPISKLSTMLEGIEGIAEKYGLDIATFGHAGDGNLHPTFLTDKRDKEEIRRVRKAMKELFILALELGGTLTGEHGIGLEKKNFMPLEHSSTLEAMKAIKRLVDPINIMNPGKIFEV